MDSITVNVPTDDMKVAIDSWEDGAEYELRVRQTAPGVFEMISGEAAEPEAPEMAEEAAEAPTPPKAPMGRKMGGENPAIALVIAAGKKQPRAAA